MGGLNIALYIDNTNHEINFIERIYNGHNLKNSEFIEKFGYRVQYVMHRTGKSNEIPKSFTYHNIKYELTKIGINLYESKHKKIERRLKTINQ
jgi:hypothetical protein